MWAEVLPADCLHIYLIITDWTGDASPLLHPQRKTALPVGICISTFLYMSAEETVGVVEAIDDIYNSSQLSKSHRVQDFKSHLYVV